MKNIIDRVLLALFSPCIADVGDWSDSGARHILALLDFNLVNAFKAQSPIQRMCGRHEATPYADPCLIKPQLTRYERVPN